MMLLGRHLCGPDSPPPGIGKRGRILESGCQELVGSMPPVEPTDPMHVRRLEDKLIHHNLDFRQFVVMADQSHLHANVAAPEAYVNLIAVSDATLPAKGAGHRTSKVTEKDGR